MSWPKTDLISASDTLTPSSAATVFETCASDALIDRFPSRLSSALAMRGATKSLFDNTEARPKFLVCVRRTHIEFF